MMEVQLVRQQRFTTTTTTTTTTRQVQQREKRRPLWQREKPKPPVSRELVRERTRAYVQKTQMVKMNNSNNTAKNRVFEKKSRYAKENTLMKGNLYRNVTELQNIIRQSSKERLQLERHLARSTEAAQRTSRIHVTQCEDLQKNNESLKQRLEDLLKTANDLQDAEIRLQKRDFQIQQLKQELDDKLLLCADLEHRLNSTLEEQGKVEKQNKDIDKLLQDLEPVDEECSKLLSCCDILSNHFTLAKSDLDIHQNKINNLETLVKHMRDAAEKRKELEKQYADTLAELQKKQDEVRHLPSSRIEKHAQDTIQSLESKVRELQKKCELQNVYHEELALEMTALRRSQSKQAWRSHRSLSADVPSETSNKDQEMDLYLVGSDTIFSSNKNYSLSSSLPQLDNTPRTPRGFNVSFEPFSSNPITSPGTNMMSPCTTVSSSSPVSSNILNSASYEIDRIIARIEQDNRILAELERSRATVGSPVSTANLERLKAQFEEDQKQSDEVTHRSNMKSSFSSPAIDQLLIESERNKQMYWQLNKSRYPRQTSVTVKELDVLMAKLEQDNKILAELDKKRATISSRRPYSATPPGTPLTSSLGGQMGNTAQSGHYSSTLPALPSTAPYSTNQLSKSESVFDELDYIDLPHRGRCKVYIARYSYDPLKQSPNENPEAELRLIAGDYLLIFGDMDEDGFFNGELLDGRKGLVPSNFVEKLTGEELYEFQSQVLYSTRDSDDGSTTVIYPEGEFLAGDDPQLFCRGEAKITTDDFHRMNDYIDLEDYDELEEEPYSLERDEGPVPPPTRLVLERQLNKSILIGWCPPDAPRGTAEAYHVYVDGVPKATIRATEKTRALVEGVDCNQPHRISVRSVNPVGRHSRDAACTILIGKDVPLAACMVKAIQVTSTSAIITWLPSNSNFQHVVAINSVEVKTLKAGIFRHNISGLAPNTTYRVSVRARPARLFFSHDNPKKIGLLTSAIEFKTLPKGCKGLPEPPLDIQIEPGPQDGTLLVTWLPVTINNRGTSNGAPVTGYAVYAGERKISEIDSPTGDHALLDLINLAPLKKRTVTVKTKSGDNLSIDSMPCVIPLELLKGVAATMMNQPDSDLSKNEDVVPKDVVVRAHPQRRRSTGSSDSESDTELAELQKHVARRTAEFDPSASATAQTSSGQQGARVEDLVEEGLRSELSDIAEEPEEDMMHSDRKERRSRDSKSPRDYDRRSDRDRRDERLDRRDERYDDRHHDDRRADDRRRDERRGDRVDDRRDRERRDRDERYDDRSRRDDRYDRRDGRMDDRRDRHGTHDPKESDISRTKHSHSHSDSRSHERHHGRASPTSMHRDSRDRSYSSRQVADTRRLNNLDAERRNSAGQVIIEPEENLSDKEIYPSSQHVIPSIEITRDSELTSHDDYMRGRSGYSDPQRYPPQYYGNESSRTRTASPTRSGRYGRSSDAHYYDQRGHSKPVRDDYHGNGYHGRSSHRYGMDKPRMYMAVYDYDPYTMSPNPALASEELAFHEGQIIKVYSEKDSDGYFTGEINGRIGLVPYKMVTEIPEEEEEAARHLLNENMSARPHHGGDPSDPWSTLPVKKLVALYDYDPQELSPNVDAEMELAFRTGDIIYVYGDADEDGFYMGELNGERGLVPSNFLTEAPPDFRDPRMQSSRGSSSYPKDHHQHRESSQYARGSSREHYSSSGTTKEHLPPDKNRYSERPTSDRSPYDRPGAHPSESNRSQYNSSSRSGQHW